MDKNQKELPKIKVYKVKSAPVANLVTPRTHALSKKYHMRSHVIMRPYDNDQYLNVNN